MKVMEVKGYFLNFQVTEFLIYYDEDNGCWRYLNGIKFDMKKDLVCIVDKYPGPGRAK